MSEPETTTEDTLLGGRVRLLQPQDGYRVAIDPVLLTAHHWLAEVVYMPLETALLRAARSRGCRTLDGGGMAVYQAAAAFHLFTGRVAGTERMRRHFESMIGQQQ